MTFDDTQDLDNPCPICGQKMKHEYYLVNEGTVGESSDECPDGHYTYEFLYGHSIVRICGVTWMFGYDEPFQDRKDRTDAITLVIERNRFPSRAAAIAMMTPEVLSRTI